jgi:hypothetical protein
MTLQHITDNLEELRADQVSRLNQRQERERVSIDSILGAEHPPDALFSQMS